MICRSIKLFAKKSEFTLIFILLSFLFTSFSAKVNAQNYAGLGANLAGIGVTAWTSPTNIYSDNTIYASSAMAGSGSSNYLKATNFGFSVPVGSTINGITVNIDRYGSAAGVRDVELKLVNGSGAIVGDNKAVTGTNWPLASTVLAYGGVSDTWNALLTVSDINDADFGVVLAVRNNNASARTAYVDYVTITVTYSAPCTNQTLTYSQGFNSSSIPICWSQQYVSGTSGVTYVASSTYPTISSPYEGSYMAKWDAYNFANGTQTRLVSAPITTTGTSSVDVEFEWYHSTDGGSGSYLTEGVQLQYSTDGTTWINAGSFIRRYNATAGWALKTTILPAGAGNQSTIYVGFLFTSNYGYNCYLDAAVVKPTPTCFAPTGVSATNITTTTATLNWTAASPVPSNGYQWEVRTSGAAGSGATGLTASGSTAAGVTTANVSSLSASTTYYAYVRSYCGGSDYSAWTSAFTFNTPCTNVSLTYSQGFNSASIPACWTQQYVSGTYDLTYVASNAANPTVGSAYEGSQMVKWDSYNILAGNQTRLVSPPITTTGSSVVITEFQWYQSNINSCCQDYVQVQYSTNGTTWTNAGASVNRYNTTTGWTLKSIELPASAGNQPTVYVGFLFTSQYGGACLMDAVVIKPLPVPGCAGNLSPLNGATNAWPGTLEWTAPTVDATHGAASGYKVYFGTDNPPANIENGTTQTGTSYTVSSLNTSTTYYWKIIAYNSTGDATACSVWSFTTPAVVPTITFTVGSGAETATHYNNIQHAYDHCTTSNPYIIEILSTYSGTASPSFEVYPIDLSTVGTVSKRSVVNNLIIRPATGISYTFTNSAAEPVFKFNGAKYVTIDGRPGGTGITHGITIVNSNTGASNHPWTVWFNNDACYNTIKYCDLKAGSTALTNAVVVISEPVTTGNNYNNIIYNNISNNTATYPESGVYAVSYTGGVYNSNNTISYNNIYDFWKYPAGIKINDNCNGFTVRGNNIYQMTSRTPTSGVSFYGIYAIGDNHTICQNNIGGSATGCGGSALTIAAAAYDSYFNGIRVSGSASSTSRVDSNVVGNIVFNTTKWIAGSPLDASRRSSASSAEGAFIGILIDQGSASVKYNTVGGNSVGNITVINCSGSSSAGNGTEAHGIDTYTDNGTVTISRNTICGINCYASNTANNFNARVMGIVSGSGTTAGPTYNITYNTIGSTTLDNAILAGNSAGTNNGDFHVIGIYNESGIGGSKATVASVYIKGNVVANLCANGNGDDGYVNGIHNVAGTLCEIDSNTVCMLRCKQATSIATETIEKRCIIGIAADNDGGFLDHFWVNRNYVYDLKSTCTGSVKVDVVGIYFRSGTAPVTGRVYKNRIWSLNASSSDYSSLLEGLWTYGQNAITYNNFITLGSDISGAGSTCPSGTPVSSLGYEIRGINNVYGKDEYYYNSVCIIGNVSGGSNSYAYKYTNTVAESNARIFKNNIFVNMRNNTGGSARHYAYSINAQEINGANFTSDYNLFYASGAGGVLFDCRGTDKTTLADWTTATTTDANSVAAGSTGSDPLFVAPTACTPDLNITNMSSPAFGAGTTTGIPAYILDDIFGTSRSGTNDIGAVVVGGTLPIELFMFSAEKYNEKQVLIEWMTATETNNDFFTIERSPDGETFSAIDMISGAGNSNTSISYKTFDENPLAGINYYRLKQTDYDGASSYSQIITVDFSVQEYESNIYPNPFSDQIVINLRGYDSNDTIITFLDLTGREVSSVKLSNSDNNIVMTFCNDVAEGYYFVKIQNEKDCKYFKVLKIKGK